MTDTWNNRIQVLDLNIDDVDNTEGKTNEPSLNVLDSYTFPGNMEPTGITKLNNGRIFICCNGFGATKHGIQEFGWSSLDPSLKPVIKKEKVELKSNKKGNDKKTSKKDTEASPEEPIEILKPKLWPLQFYGNKVNMISSYKIQHTPFL